MAHITCGNCKSTHDSVGAVKACYATTKLRDQFEPEMTGPQRRYLLSLAGQIDTLVGNSDLEGEVMKATLTKSEASKVIDEYSQTLARLKAATPVVIRPTIVIPDGRYAIETDRIRFYVVKDNFVWVQASDELHRVHPKMAERVREYLQDDDRRLAALKLYGHTIGRCGVCGRTLTDPTSRAAGIGPICANKF